MPTAQKVFQALATFVDARERCAQTGNEEWFEKHEDECKRIVTHYLPSGSGIDCGTKLDFGASTGEKLVFTFSYHHMAESGMYDGWTEHTLIVKASMVTEFTMRITGRDRNCIKDYLYDIYGQALHEVYTPFVMADVKPFCPSDVDRLIEPHD